MRPNCQSLPFVGCINANTVMLWFDGELSPEDRAAVQDHVDECDDCRTLFGELARVDESGEAPDGVSHVHHAARVAVGRRIDRYAVLEWLGEGGMGVVYGAYDPKLDRRVAIKVLRVETDRDESGARLLREAQSLARVSHPNVIAVYDAGDHEGHIFVAMEYVRGGTMAEWLRREKPPWQTILARYLDAARGLAAVHAAGLVHRDFKPNNVLFGDDGRVHVTDFGLARVVGGADEGNAPREASWLGTPGYIAPEQRTRGAVDARSDQYSFCVALHEALYGELPSADFADATRSRVPTRIRHALDRGLSTRPADRFPSMEALIAELSHDRRAKWLRIGGALVAASGIAFGTLALSRSMPGQVLPTPCAGAERKLAGVWDDARKTAIRAAFIATGLPYAGDAWRDTERAIDGYTARWVSMHTQTCEATRVHGDQSEELMDLRIACLDVKERELKAMTDLFAAGNRKSIERSAQVISALPGIDACTDVAALRVRVRTPPNAAARTEAERLCPSVDQAMALLRAGDYAAADTVARPLLAAVKSTGDRALESNVHYVLARVHANRSEWHEGEAAYYDALVAAEAAGDEVAKARALTGLVYVLVHQENKDDETLRAGKHAVAVLEHLPEETDVRATLENNLALIDLKAARDAESLSHYDRALMLRQQQEPDSHGVAITLANMANVMMAMGDYERAFDHQKRAIEIYERRLGPHHPLLGLALSNVAISEMALRRLDEALRHEQRARDIFIKSFGQGHTDVARAGGIIADILREMGRLPEALSEAKNTLAMAEKLFPDDRDMANALNSVSMIYLRQGRAREAIALGSRALALCEKLGNPPLVVPDVLRVLGEGYLADGQPKKALEYLERSISYPSSMKTASPEWAYTNVLLARALWETGHDRTRARTLAEQARDTYASLAGYEAERDAAAAWLAQRPSTPSSR